MRRKGNASSGILEFDTAVTTEEGKGRVCEINDILSFSLLPLKRRKKQVSKLGKSRKWLLTDPLSQPLRQGVTFDCGKQGFLLGFPSGLAVGRVWGTDEKVRPSCQGTEVMPLSFPSRYCWPVQRRSFFPGPWTREDGQVEHCSWESEKDKRTAHSSLSW